MDIDLSQFKEILKKAGVLKNYLSLIVPGIIVLIAAGLFVFSGMLKGNLSEEIRTESLGMARDVDSYLEDSVPVDQWEVEKEYIQSLAKDANRAQGLIENAGKRELLSYDIFPEPNDPSTLIFRQFGDAYRQEIEKNIEGFQGVSAPTDVEISKNIQLVSRSSDTSISSSSINNLDPVNAAIVDAMCKERANTGKVYVEKEKISGYLFWEDYNYEGLKKAIADCWSFQMGNWIIKDVFDSVRKMNANSNSVFESPIKKINTIKFSEKELGSERSSGYSSDYSSSSSTSLEEVEKPIYVTSLEDALVQPYTGRTNNENIDVIQFIVDVVLDSRDVLKFMDELCSVKEHKFKGFDGLQEVQKFKHNQITILTSKIYSVNEDSEENVFCRFGDEAIVGLEIVCEYVLPKASYSEIRPKELETYMMPESEMESDYGSDY